MGHYLVQAKNCCLGYCYFPTISNNEMSPLKRNREYLCRFRNNRFNSVIYCFQYIQIRRKIQVSLYEKVPITLSPIISAHTFIFCGYWVWDSLIQPGLLRDEYRQLCLLMIYVSINKRSRLIAKHNVT